MGVGGSSIVGQHSRSFGVLPSLSSKVFTLFPDYQVWGNGTDNGIKSLGLFTTSDSWYDGIEMISAYLGLYSVSMSALNEEYEMTLLLIINVGFHCQYSPFSLLWNCWFMVYTGSTFWVIRDYLSFYYSFCVYTGNCTK